MIPLVVLGRGPMVESITDLVVNYEIIDVVNTDCNISRHIKDKRVKFVSCIGSNLITKHKELKRLEINIGRYINVIDPNVDITFHQTGCGNIILKNSVITSTCYLKNHNFIMHNCVLSHDVELGSCVTLASGVVLNGGVTVKNNCFLGSNSTVKEGVTISENTVVGAGCVVTKDIGGGTYVGVPARKV